MNTLPAHPSIADEVAKAQRLLDEAQERYDAWSGDLSTQKAQASAQMATVHVLLALGTEIAIQHDIQADQARQIAGIRREITDLTAAVRELAATVEKSADPIAEAARALPAIADAGLSNIATAVESLVTAVDDRQQRRSWWGRRRYTRPNTPEVSA